MAATDLNPQAPIFIPMQISHLSPIFLPLPLIEIYPNPYIPILPFSAPTSPFFLLYFSARPPPPAHDKAAAVFPARHAGGGKKNSCRMKSGNCGCVRADVAGEGWKKMRRREMIRKGRGGVLSVTGDGNFTTIMLRNIPTKYTRRMLVEFLDRHCKSENEELEDWSSGDGGGGEVEGVSAFDFLYLPVDFRTGMNKGYAFVNFTTAGGAWKFKAAADNQTWDLCNSSKVRRIARARLQGKEELLRHFENMGFPCETVEVLPVRFSPPRDGSGKSVKETTVGLIGGAWAT